MTLAAPDRAKPTDQRATTRRDDLAGGVLRLTAESW